MLWLNNVRTNSGQSSQNVPGLLDSLSFKPTGNDFEYARGLSRVVFLPEGMIGLSLDTMDPSVSDRAILDGLMKIYSVDSFGEDTPNEARLYMQAYALGADTPVDISGHDRQV